MSLEVRPGLRHPKPFLTAIALAAFLSPAGVAGVPEAAPGPFWFTARGPEAGLVHKTFCGGPDKQHLMASGGNGAAIFDFDGDGVLDIYLVNSWRYGEGKVLEKPLHRLYRGKGRLTYEDVTEKAGIHVDDFGCGVACADQDDDGSLDIYVTDWGPNRLLRNDGRGAFTEVGREAGVDDPGWSTGAAFFDADGDGDLDLYVANYIDATLESVLTARRHTTWRSEVTVMDGPFGLPGGADHYYQNLGNGRLREATKEAGLEDTGKYFGYTVTATDIDDDGDADLYVANDSNPNFLYLNDGKGRFRDESLLSGASLSGEGAAQASMGVDVADFDLDGKLDIVVTNFAKDNATLYRNLGSGLFQDVSAEAGIAGPTFDSLKWGTALADFDLDGDPDLFIACGHIYPEVDAAPKLKESYRQRNILLENRAGKFLDVTDRSGPGLQVVESHRGTAVADLDDDGDLDLLLTAMDAVPTILVNGSPRKGHHLAVKLHDPRSNHFAVGAKVTLTAGGKVMVREVRSGGNYISQSDLRAHFGIPQGSKAERLEVRWPDGEKGVYTELPLDREMKIDRRR